MQHETIIFLHIPKAAGTTLHRIIEQQYKPRDIYSAYPSLFQPNASLQELFSMPAARRAEICMLKGHVPYGVHRAFAGPTTYFTLLRNPVERVISFFYFVRGDGKHYLHDYTLSDGVDIRTFITSRATIAVDNFQTRMLAGDWWVQPFGGCTAETLATAKENLSRHFTVVGLAEKFDETLLLLQRAFGWRSTYYIRQNVTRGRPKVRELPGGALDLIRAHNQLDLELYEYAKALFDAQVQQQGVLFPQAVEHFQWQNLRLQPLLSLYWEARKYSVRAWAHNVRQRLSGNVT